MRSFVEPELINATDFHVLVSCTDPEALMPERKKIYQNLIESFCLHLFDDERLFYEILYIKLSFIEKIIDKISDSIDLVKYPDLGFSTENIWIRLFPAYNGLPVLWNFRVELIEKQSVKNNNFGKIFPPDPPGYAFSFLGAIWLFTLGINHKTDPGICRERIEKLFKLIGGHENNSYLSLLDDKESVFRPENIFFTPDNRAVPEKIKEYWEKSFEMACNLLSPLYDAPVSEIKDYIKKLKHEIRCEMLNQAFLPKFPPENKDKAILKILKTIENKWMVFEKDSIEKSADEPEDMMETVILSRESLGQDDEMPETVILSSPKGALEAEDDDMPETVVLSSPKKALEAEGDDMPETVVLSSPKGALEAEDDEMPETVVLSSPKKALETEDDDDFMMKTVILRSGGPDNKPDKTDKKD